MLYVEGEGCVNVALPIGECFARETIHQVDADITDAGIAEMVDGFLHLTRGVAAVEEIQPLVVEGLGTHGDTVDAELR